MGHLAIDLGDVPLSSSFPALAKRASLDALLGCICNNVAGNGDPLHHAEAFFPQSFFFQDHLVKNTSGNLL